MSDTLAREKALVLLHSLGTDSNIWNGVRRYLSASHQVVTPDAKGHGGYLESGIDEDVWVADLDRLIDSLGEVDIHLVGLSMGGVQALAYASRYAHKIASMTLANTFAYLEPEVSRARLEGIGGRVESLGMTGYADAYVNETVKVGVDSAEADQMRASIASIPADIYLESVRATFLVDLREALGRIDVPTLVIHAEYDDKTPRYLSDYICENVAGARMVSIEQAGHLSAFDAPAQFASEVDAFIEAVQSKNQGVEVRV